MLLLFGERDMQTTHETLKILLGSDARVRPDEQQGKSAMGGIYSLGTSGDTGD